MLRAIIVAALAGASTCWCTSAPAAFLDCQGILHRGPDQVVIGDIGQVGPVLAMRLRNRLRQQVAELKASLGMDINDVQCPGHSPSKSDYSRDIVASRFADGVLLELWGTSEGGDAEMVYAILPLLPPNSSEPSGFYEVGYHAPAEADISAVFAEAVELRAFAALGIGLHALGQAKKSQQGVDYNRAYASLCKADGLLAEAQRRANPDGPTDKEWSALRNVATASARDARAGAGTAVRGGPLATPPAGVMVGNCSVPAPDPPLPVLAATTRGPTP
jgi:hypothetical protein